MRVAFATIVFGLAASSAHAELPTGLAQAAKDYDTAQMKGDGQALGRLLADDYTLVNGGGEVEDKNGLIRDYTDPGYHLDPYVVEQPIEKVWGDAAVLGGIVHLSGVDGGKRFQVTARFADIWAKRDGKWQVIYTEVTRVPSQKAK